MPTFAEAAGRVIEQKRAGWRSPKTARLWIRSLEMYAFPRLGNLPVSEITSGDVLETLSPIWHARPKVARAVRLRVRAVLEWAVAMDWRTDNPCDRLLPVLGPQHDVVTHRKALPHGEVAAAIAKVRAAKPGKVDTLAFEFLVLTAARGGEIRGAVWAEIDQGAGVWTIPASRTKTAREHRVPLSGRALEILDAARKLWNGESPIVFVNERGKPLTRKRPGRLLLSCGVSAVPHGFRSSFRDWAAERTDHPRQGCGPSSGVRTAPSGKRHASLPMQQPSLYEAARSPVSWASVTIWAFASTAMAASPLETIQRSYGSTAGFRLTRPGCRSAISYGK